MGFLGRSIGSTLGQWIVVVVYVRAVDVAVVFLVAMLLQVVLLHEPFGAKAAGEGHPRQDGMGLLLVFDQIDIVLVHFSASVT